MHADAVPALHRSDSGNRPVHLRLGYGRAARILDMMQRDGIIGPPDGSKPREVLKTPDWIREVEPVN